MPDDTPQHDNHDSTPNRDDDHESTAETPTNSDSGSTETTGRQQQTDGGEAPQTATNAASQNQKDDIELASARGFPAFWSSLLGIPIALVGLYIFQFQDQYPLVADQPQVPTDAGLMLAGFGAFVMALGLYVQFIAAPKPPRMRENEYMIDTRNPAQRAVLFKAFLGIPLFAAGIYLLYFTTYPYVYPTVALAVGLYVFSTGLYGYWQNTLTTYVVTNMRVIEEYRFLSLTRTEVPLDKVKSVQERKSALESIFGLGNVTVSSGGAGSLSVTIRGIYDSTKFADLVRKNL